MRRITVLMLLALVAAACGDDDSSVTAHPPDRAPRYRVAYATVLESPEHGPQLCFAVEESYPPQCGGIDVDGWDWADVPDAESANGTTWASVSVTGTYDGGTFTVEEVGDAEPLPPEERDFTPICDDYDHDAPQAPLDVALDDIDGVAAVWVSDPSGDWDGPFVVNVVATPGNGDAVRAAVEERWDGALCVVERDQPTAAELEAVQQEVHDADDAPWGEVISSGGDPVRGVVVVEVLLADDAARRYAENRWGDAVELHGVLQPVD